MNPEAQKKQKGGGETGLTACFTERSRIRPEKPDCISLEPKSRCLGSSGLGKVWGSPRSLRFETNHWLSACSLRRLVSASRVWRFHPPQGPQLVVRARTHTDRRQSLRTSRENGLILDSRTPRPHLFRPAGQRPIQSEAREQCLGCLECPKCRG